MTLLAANVAIAVAQRPGVFSGSLNDPAIRYAEATTRTAIDELNKKLSSGAITLPHDEVSGYLKPVLGALGIPIESQVLVYTHTSQQAFSITPDNPRAIYFNDSIAVAFTRGAPLLEAWAIDPRQGTIFYAMDQKAVERGAPGFSREMRCLTCHVAWETLSVPGPFVLTTFPREFEYQGADGFAVDHRDDLSRRWGGWYVTGRKVPSRHMGNLPLFMSGDPPASSPVRTTLAGTVDLTGYPAPYSDVVALMVLEHQTHAINLMTRLAWESRIGSVHVEEAIRELVDYLLFVGEARIAAPVEGSSGFAEKFSAGGPKDSRGRSLRELQMDGRMMKYPLSYMIYSPAFDAIPDTARGLVQVRLREILSGGDPDPKYSHLTPEIRIAILEILKDTKPL
jgi:hypothetical protein